MAPAKAMTDTVGHGPSRGRATGIVCINHRKKGGGKTRIWVRKTKKNGKTFIQKRWVFEEDLLPIRDEKS